MAVLKMGELIYRDYVEVLKNDRIRTNNRRVVHADLLKNEAINVLDYSLSDGDYELYYLIQLFLENGIPFLQEINDMKPKYHIMYVPNNLFTLSEKQVDYLLDKCKKMKSFKQRGNKLSIASFDDYLEFKNGNYIVYTLEELISSLYKVKYDSVMYMDSSKRRR